jgi:hypothetical protein
VALGEVSESTGGWKPDYSGLDRANVKNLLQRQGREMVELEENRGVGRGIIIFNTRDNTIPPLLHSRHSPRPPGDI